MYLFRVSKQLISRIIPEVCAAIMKALASYVRMPETEAEWLQTCEEFETLWNFPQCIGSIVGKHVVLQCPKKTGSDFFNYKSFFSIVLFALVDANYNFLYVGVQGRISDGGIFKNTELYERLQNNALNLPLPKPLPGREKAIPYVILGDEAFALADNLMKPYSGIYEKGSIQRIFNYRLSRARRVVENAFGILASVFRVLRKPMLLEPHKAELVVMTCIYLHNFLRKSKSSANIYCAQGALDSEVEGKVIPGAWRNDTEMLSLINIKKVPRKSAKIPQEIREEFAAYFSSNGAIPWQNEHA
ncbi:uncharacterized protein LOC116160192 [Photinus pyralis]|uniref:uncharacterized protein LOC116160192 n=1 Tax=Photinus pyralis TaxID=7054 RepID=UPI0012676949|nr:uncharacterized protein LOC116160192 [Photinus pyralis]